MGDTQNGNSDKLGKDADNIAGKASQIMKLMEQLSRMKATEEQPEMTREHKFWTTQPVLKSTASPEDIQDGPIEPLKQVESVRVEPYPLPAEFQWCIVSVHDPAQRDELYQLLNLNYVEDVESLFRFDYPPQFLEWALRAPGWHSEWQIGVRVVETGKLVAFISAVPTTLSIRSWDVPSVEVNFLCVHKKLRSKRLAPLLIREITRRVNLEGIFQALYTAGAVLPGVLCKAQYYHRPLNYKKLVEVGFTAVPLGKSIDQMTMRHHLAKEHQLGDSIRPMGPADVPTVTTLLSKHLAKFPLHPKFTEHEVAHWLLPREKVIYSYVVETLGEITDFVSFYSLPSTVVDNPLHDRINVAYLFYYAASSSERLVKIVHAALVIAKELDFDVFNCVEIMDNSQFLKELKFGGGDGCLNYYLYNWQTRPFKASDVSTVML